MQLSAAEVWSVRQSSTAVTSQQGAEPGQHRGEPDLRERSQSQFQNQDMENLLSLVLLALILAFLSVAGLVSGDTEVLMGS